MTKKRGKLKQLFIFNGLLLLVAFILIQYSVVRHADDKEDTNPVLGTKISDERIRSIYKEVAQGSFLERLNVFDPSFTPENIAFKNLLGRDMTLDDLKGQWIVLNFWASWCPPCITEMPSLQALQDAYGGQGIKVVGIGLDRNMDGSQLRQVMQRYNFGPVAAYYGEWPVIKEHFEINSLPTTYILSPNGQAIAKIGGHVDWMSAEVTSYIDGLIGQ